MMASAPFDAKSRLQQEDIFWGNPHLAFVGIGEVSNIPGVRTLIAHARSLGIENPFASKRLAVVRDIFDRSPARPSLSSYFRMVTDDIALILSDVQRPPLRRLVNEYVVNPNNGALELVQHDVDFNRFLKSKGFRVIPVKTQEQLRNYTPSQVPIQQSTNHVLMVAPTAFEHNLTASLDNHFMGTPPPLDELKHRVLMEFEGLHRQIHERAEVHLFTHETHHDTPDAVFPNNWFSTHTDLETRECTLVLYPMKVPNRRLERRPEFLRRLFTFGRYTNVIDLTRQESQTTPRFLEGTGSIVLDRVRGVAFVAVSERSDPKLAQKWARMLGYEVVLFDSLDQKGRPIYHTNVMMAIGTSVAVVCGESIPDKAQRDRVFGKLRETHAVVDITLDQVNNFCGNILEIEDYYGRPVMVMSSAAHNAFTPEQRGVMLQHVHELVHSDISTIEKVGGGGTRCAIAELF
eukprot:TRINITY_DN1084_c0_g1_i1.p1 TRINITY_DN1084_c0_g1~~TRINITY_DN1084_c0_g1_i1.p1  ORF type:complete len:461 (-),score=99.34 TRINITY_DN1084_c0_g1_i1:26-1408(-)